MSLVTIVPNSSTSTSAPGWAYIPSTSYIDPSKAPLVPTSRKRARNAPSSTPSTAGAHEALSLRARTKIEKHIAELDRDSTRDTTQITVPGKSKDIGARGMSRSGKMTQGVRRILGSQKTWANYLADEEAMLANQGPSTPVVVMRQATAEDGQRRGSVKQGRTVGTGAGPGRKRASLLSRGASTADLMDVDSPSTPTPQTPITQPATGLSNPSIEAPITPAQPPADDIDNDPFLKSYIPPLPTKSEIDALLAAPPLSYNAARAAPSTSTAPPRQFCEICGYWGRAKCMKCGVRVCGLECKTQHDETRCQKFYA